VNQNGYDLELRGVRKEYGEVVAVDTVSFQVRRGEFLTLLGPSGCGKTTVLRMVAGLETPSAGQILLRGDDITQVPPYRRDVHTVFQQYALFPHLTVAENVAFGLQRKGLPKVTVAAKVQAALSQVQLEMLAGRMPRQLSGGEQQRVALARALVLEPKVLLLDEPLGALDLKLRREMQIELKALNRRSGIAFIFVTHDQEEALSMSDRIAVMRAGRVEQLDSAETLYETPRTEFVANFLGTSNMLPGVVRQSEGDFADVEVLGLVVRCYSQRRRTPGESVQVAVRPEKIAVATGTARRGSAWSGTISARIYLGTSTTYRVQLSGGPELTVFEQNRACADEEKIEVGATVNLIPSAGAPTVLD
jgi:spermidine/putrescine transport system ATP-binding protein